VLQGESKDIEIGKGLPAFETTKGLAEAPEALLGVNPRCEDSFAGAGSTFIEKAVKNTQARVGHADIIDIGECKTPTNRGVGIDRLLVELPSGVSRGA
jgi:hypothetical protein